MGVEQRGRVDVSVAMDLAEAQELGVLEPGNQAQNARLLAEPQLILKADQVEAVGAQILLAQLHDGPGPAAGARIGRGPSASSARSAACRGRGARSLRSAGRPRSTACRPRRCGRTTLSRCEQLVDEALVLLSIERAVQVIVGAVDRLAVARRPERDRSVDRIGIHDRADAVVEEQAVGAGEARDLGGQRIAGQRPGGDDRRCRSGIA